MQFDASSFGPLLRDTVTAVRANAPVLGMVYAAATVVGVGYDRALNMLGDAAVLYYLVAMFFMLFLQACATIAVLEQGGVVLPSPRRWRIASLFGLGLLVGLGIFVGFLALILPGLFLAGRWYLAAPALFAGDSSVSEAMSDSWERTEQHWLGITLLAIFASAWQVTPLVAAFYLLPDMNQIDWAASLAMNALSYAGWLFGVTAAATAYLALRRQGDRTRQIFG